MKKLIIILMLILLPFISAVQVGNVGTEGINFAKPTSPINYTTVNTNNSLFLQGYVPNDFWQVANNQVGLTGSKDGSFNLSTTGNILINSSNSDALQMRNSTRYVFGVNLSLQGRIILFGTQYTGVTGTANIVGSTSPTITTPTITTPRIASIFGGTANSSNLTLQATTIGTSNGNGNIIFALNGTIRNTEWMRIDNIGNIGIKTKTPTTNLDVNGSSIIRENLNITGNISVKRAYGMYSSTQIQTIAVINTPYPVTFNWTESSWLINKASDNSNFSFQQTGNYLIELSAIAQGSQGNRVQIWVQKNNVNVPRSNTVYDFKGTGTNAVISVPFILDMNKTDVMRIMWASDNTGTILQYITNTSYSPETPSIIMTISKNSELTT